MSMMSSQRDQLKETASKLRENYAFVGFGGTVSRDQLIFDAAQQMDLAADTIWELRNKLAGVVDERERVRALQIENDALRDLAYEMWGWMGRARYDGAIRCDEMDEIGRRAVGLGLLAHELGIEADSQD